MLLYSDGKIQSLEKPKDIGFEQVRISVPKRKSYTIYLTIAQCPKRLLPSSSVFVTALIFSLPSFPWTHHSQIY